MQKINNAGYLRRITEGTPLDQGDGKLACLWQLVTNDTAAAVTGTGYLNPAKARLNVGDMILASMDLDGTPAGKIYMVTAISTNVTIAEAHTAA